MKHSRSLTPVWKPWHTASTPNDYAIILTTEELAEIEDAMSRRKRDTQRRALVAANKRRKEARLATRDAEEDNAD
jgi:hypothetical protein